jgi:WD40 repeat protein
VRVPVAGGRPERIAPALSDDRLLDVRFHPDGQRLAYSANDGTDEVWVTENLLPGESIDARQRRSR